MEDSSIFSSLEIEQLTEGVLVNTCLCRLCGDIKQQLERFASRFCQALFSPMQKGVEKQWTVRGSGHLQLAETGRANVILDNCKRHFSSIVIEMVTVVICVLHSLPERCGDLFAIFSWKVHGVGKARTSRVDQAQLYHNGAIVKAVSTPFAFDIICVGVIGISREILTGKGSRLSTSNSGNVFLVLRSVAKEYSN